MLDRYEKTLKVLDFVTLTFPSGNITFDDFREAIDLSKELVKEKIEDERNGVITHKEWSAEEIMRRD